MLSGHDLQRSFGQTKALDSASIELAPSSITALIGPSGSGKTTLLKALSFLEPPSQGTVELDGLVLTAGEAHPWPAITVVFQQLFLWPHMTIRQNCELPLKRLSREDRLPAINGLFQRYGIERLDGRYPNEISAGQRQLVALVRAVALEPKYLLLDEVTSALDVEYVGDVLAHLDELRGGGTGILVITHSLRFAERSASQIVFMDHGRIVESGSPKILQEPNSARLRSFVSAIERSV